MFYMGYEALAGGGHFLAFTHFLICMGRRGCKSALPNACHAAIQKTSPLASCIAKTTENRKSPERPILSGFPGIDTKTALQKAVQLRDFVIPEKYGIVVLCGYAVFLSI